jgi:hypothetical protein
MHAAAERGSQLLGVVENLVGPQFPGDAGESLAREFDLPLLARVPWYPPAPVWDALAGRLAGGAA